MMKPKDFLKKTQAWQKNIEYAESKEIAVGLPKQSGATSKIYENGMTVLSIGIIHEYGRGNNKVRSFLRVPFYIKRTDIAKALSVSFKKIFNGADAAIQMGRTGAYLKNISLASFNNRGYGKWKDIKLSTARRKGLEDTTPKLTESATLKQSITDVVRNAT
jgi:hypothetical protein